MHAGAGAAHVVQAGEGAPDEHPHGADVVGASDIIGAGETAPDPTGAGVAETCVDAEVPGVPSANTGVASLGDATTASWAKLL